MPRWLYRLLSGRDELLLDVSAPKRKAMTTQKERDRQKMLETTRTLRMELKLPWRI